MHLEPGPESREPFDFAQLQLEVEQSRPDVPDVIVFDEAGTGSTQRNSGIRYWVSAGVLGFISIVWLGVSLAWNGIEQQQAEAVAAAEQQQDDVDPADESDAEAQSGPALADGDNPGQEGAAPDSNSNLALATAPVVVSVPKLVLDDLSPQSIERTSELPRRSQLDDRVEIKAVTGEGPIPLETALDRVTWEIAANLKEQKVLVVWLLDASGSLAVQRKALAKRFRQIYGELQGGDQPDKGRRQDAPLLTGVVTFGEKTNFVTPEPISDVQQIIKAVDTVSEDKTGTENVFEAVEQTLARWLKYRTQRGRRIMLITVTDEAGDDFEAHLDSAVKSASKNGVRIYVLGPASVFGRRQGYLPYVHPMDGKTYQIPVDIGPETAVPENVQLPFWYNGPQHETISSGLGPYGLSRLVSETNGIYFVMQTSTNAVLDGSGMLETPSMKPFEPDYRLGTPEAYENDLRKHPLRRAVVDAAERSRRYKAKGTPQLELRVTPENFLKQLSMVQETVAVSTAMIDNILEPFSGKLEQEYQKETSPRWRVAYDLSLGRLLAQKVRCQEYNSACAQLKSIGAKEVATKSNHWRFVPDTDLHHASGMKKTAAEAERLLKRVIAEDAGTPWAVLASRELKDPFGIKVVQRFDPLPPKSTLLADKKKRKRLELAAEPGEKKSAPARPEPVREGTIVLPKF